MYLSLVQRLRKTSTYINGIKIKAKYDQIYNRVYCFKNNLDTSGRQSEWLFCWFLKYFVEGSSLFICQ